MDSRARSTEFVALGHPGSEHYAGLETFANPGVSQVEMTSDELVAVCPITGHPDLYVASIDYTPKDLCLESKSLKLYLNSFRNVGAFHEECTVSIGKRVVKLLAPKWLRIGGYFYPRGGMPIDVFWQAGRLPAGIWMPDQGVPPYRARG